MKGSKEEGIKLSRMKLPRKVHKKRIKTMRNEPWTVEPSAIKQTPPQKGLHLSWQRDARVN